MQEVVPPSTVSLPSLPSNFALLHNSPIRRLVGHDLGFDQVAQQLAIDTVVLGEDVPQRYDIDPSWDSEYPDCCIEQIFSMTVDRPPLLLRSCNTKQELGGRNLSRSSFVSGLCLGLRCDCHTIGHPRRVLLSADRGQSLTREDNKCRHTAAHLQHLHLLLLPKSLLGKRLGRNPRQVQILSPRLTEPKIEPSPVFRWIAPDSKGHSTRLPRCLRLNRRSTRSTR